MIGAKTIEVAQDVSEVDGTPVLFIDTPDVPTNANGPRLRIHLNDSPVWVNPPLHGQIHAVSGDNPIELLNEAIDQVHSYWQEHEPGNILIHISEANSSGLRLMSVAYEEEIQ